MATQREVRRAIYMGNKWLSSLYSDMPWKGKTYGKIAGGANLPIVARIPGYVPNTYFINAPGDDSHNFLLGPGYATHTLYAECEPLEPMLTWHETARLENTSSLYVGDRYVFETDLTLGYYKYYYLADVYAWADAAILHLKFETDPDNKNSLMKATITLNDWKYEHNGDIFLGTDPIFPSAKNHKGETVIRKAKVFPANMYVPEETIDIAYLWWYRFPALRGKAKKIFLLADDYGYKAGDPIRTAYLLGAKSPYSDWWWTRPEDIAHTCDVWADLPKGINFTPDWTKKCLCRMNVTCDARACDPEISTFLYGHIMDRLARYGPKTRRIGECYVEPDIPFYDSCWWIHELKCALPEPYRECPQWNCWRDYSVEDFVFNGWSDCITGQSQPPLIDDWRSMLDPNAKCFGYIGVGFGLALASALAWGYGYTDLQPIADGLADLAVKSQIGYPFNPGEESKFYPADAPNPIFRSDLSGAFPWGFSRSSGEIRHGCLPECVGTELVHETIAQLFHWGQPGELPIYGPAWVEATIPLIMALQTYEYYKYRLK